MLYEQEFLYSLFLTSIIEISVVVIFVRYFFRCENITTARSIFVGFVSSALTLPYFWFVLPAYISDRNVYIVVGEISIILIEVLMYNQFLKLSLPKAFAISFIANLASVFLGFLFL